MRFGHEIRARIDALVRDDDVEGLRALLDTGLSPLANDTTLATPVSLAAQAGARNCVRLLLERGGSPDAGDPPPLSQLPREEARLAAGAALLEECR